MKDWQVAFVSGCSAGPGVQMAKALANRGGGYRRRRAPYHAAKGVVNLTRALAAEWGQIRRYGQRDLPRLFYTPLTADTLNSDFFRQNAKTMIPEERCGEEGGPDTAVLFPASSASASVTGVNLPADGGCTAM